MMEPTQHRTRNDLALTHGQQCKHRWDTLVEALMWAVFIEVAHCCVSDTIGQIQGVD
jgi:hypothetical protein